MKAKVFNKITGQIVTVTSVKNHPAYPGETAWVDQNGTALGTIGNPNPLIPLVAVLIENLDDIVDIEIGTREAKHISKADYAEAAGIALRHLYDYERYGSNISVTNLLRLLRPLGLSLAVVPDSL